MSKETKVNNKDTPFAPKMLFDEDRPGAVKIKARDYSVSEGAQAAIDARNAEIVEDRSELITMGKNTQRLWSVVKDSIMMENPPYIQEHGSDDEAALFLILSRYINDYMPWSEEDE